MSDKNGTTTLLLCILLGSVGAHRFYVGKTGSGIAMLVTLGGLGIWSLYDLVMIVTGKFVDASGCVVAVSTESGIIRDNDGSDEGQGEERKAA